jgi:hypothetical protein
MESRAAASIARRGRRDEVAESEPSGLPSLFAVICRSSAADATSPGSSGTKRGARAETHASGMTLFRVLLIAANYPKEPDQRCQCQTLRYERN